MIVLSPSARFYLYTRMNVLLHTLRCLCHACCSAPFQLLCCPSLATFHGYTKISISILSHSTDPLTPVTPSDPAVPRSYTNTSITHWDWYCTSHSALATFLKALLTSFVPALIVVLWQGLCVPRLIYLVAQAEGRHLSLSSLDRRMGEIFFYWWVE